MNTPSALLRSAFIAVFLFLTAAGIKAQCVSLSMSTLKSLWLSKTKEDKLLQLGFEKRSEGTFAKCRTITCSTGDSVNRNYNEFIFVYDDELKYSTYDKDAYLKDKEAVTAKGRYIGNAVILDIKRDYYFDGKIYYYFEVGVKRCLSITVNDYNIGFIQKEPSFLNKE